MVVGMPRSYGRDRAASSPQGLIRPLTLVGGDGPARRLRSAGDPALVDCAPPRSGPADRPGGARERARGRPARRRAAGAARDAVAGRAGGGPDRAAAAGSAPLALRGARG